MPTNRDLGRAVRRLRQARGLSIEDLAVAAHMSPTYLGKVERGEHSPTWAKLCGLAGALGLTLGALVLAAETVMQKK